MNKVPKKIFSLLMVIGILFSFPQTGYSESLTSNSQNEKKAIVIVPGICGSELFSAKDQRINGVEYEKGHRFWPPQCITPFFDDEEIVQPEDFSEFQLESIINDLKLICANTDGSSKIEMMASNPVLDCRNNNERRNFGIVDCYRKLIDSIIRKTNKDEYDVLFFSYDWRQSNTDIALELERIINDNNYKEVELIGHSMGCLVCASYLTKEENKAKVDKSIFLGAPFLGAPKAFSVLDEGKFVDGLLGIITSPVINPIIKDITRNCKAVYELLPPKQHFDILKDGYLQKENEDGDIKQFKTYKETVDYINYKIGGKSTKQLLKKAQDFHDTLYKNGKFVLADKNLKVYNIVGINQATPGKVEVKVKRGNIKRPNEEKKVNGDGMVSVQSALVGKSLDKKNNYYLKGVSHMGLMSRPTSVQLVCDILNNKVNINKMNKTIVTDKRPEEKKRGIFCMCM